MRTTTAIALVALQAASTLAWNSTCKEGVGPCMGPEVVALQSSDCQDYHIFLARGSNSGYPGHQGNLVKLICDGLGDSCGYEDIIYPANASTAGPGMWCKSANIGAVNGQKQMTDYSKKCPKAKLILSGFSQGASVAQDILGGGGGKEAGGFGCDTQPVNGPLERSEVPGSRIVAAITFGAVVRAAGQNFTVATSDKVDFHGENPQDFNGMGTRTEESLSYLNDYADIFREYCNIGDGVCAPGSKGEALENHLNYFDMYNQEAADWIIQTASGKKAAKAPKASTTGGVSTPTPSTAQEANEKTTGSAKGGDSASADKDGSDEKTGAASSVAASLSAAGFAVIVGAAFQLL